MISQPYNRGFTQKSKNGGNAQYKHALIEETISDSWDEIIAACNDGSYATKYRVGDIKTIDLGSEGMNAAQIVAIDADERADGNGTAHITWITQYMLNTYRRMNPKFETNSDGTNKEGTGMHQGWEMTELRSYIYSNIKPLIPDNIRNAIIPVVKYCNHNPSGDHVTDEVWIPSYREVFGYKNAEEKGVIYSNIFNSSDSRKKKKLGESSYFSWYLRSYYTKERCYSVDAKGSSNTGTTISSVSTERGVVIGFCI